MLLTNNIAAFRSCRKVKGSGCMGVTPYLGGDERFRCIQNVRYENIC